MNRWMKIVSDDRAVRVYVGSMCVWWLVKDATWDAMRATE